jgi:hypothetical protein
VKRGKIEVQRKRKDGGLSRRNPSENNFKEWIRSKVNTHSKGAKIFQAVRS